MPPLELPRQSRIGRLETREVQVVVVGAIVQAAVFRSRIAEEEERRVVVPPETIDEAPPAARQAVVVVLGLSHAV